MSTIKNRGVRSRSNKSFGV